MTNRPTASDFARSARDAKNRRVQNPEDRYKSAYEQEESTKAPLSYEASVGASILLNEAIIYENSTAAFKYIERGANLSFNSTLDSQPIFKALEFRQMDVVNKIIRHMTEKDVKSYNNLYHSVVMYGFINELKLLCERVPPTKEEMVEVAEKLISASRNYVFSLVAKAGLCRKFTPQDWQYLKDKNPNSPHMCPVDEARSLAEEATNRANAKMLSTARDKQKRIKLT